MKIQVWEGKTSKGLYVPIAIRTPDNPWQFLPIDLKVFGRDK